MTGAAPGSPGSAGQPGSPAASGLGAVTRLTPRLQTLLFALALLAVAAVSVGGYWYAERRADVQADNDAEDAANAAASSAELVVERVTNALAGASTLARRDASLDIVAFDAFASSLDEIGAGDGAALLGVVDDDDRRDWEVQYGVTVRAMDGDELVEVPAGAADVYYPVVAVEGRSDPSSLVGFDFGSEAVRAEAAEDAVRSGGPVLSSPLALADIDEQAVLVMHPIVADFDDGPATTIGLVATPLPVADLAAAVIPTVPTGSQVAIADGDVPVLSVGQPTGGRTTVREVELAGRTWRITVDPPAAAGPSVGALVLAAGSALWLGLALLLAVTLRYQRRLGALNASLADAEQRSRTLERLASRLSRALSSAEVGEELLASIHRLTGAGRGAVLIPASVPDQLEVVASTGAGRGTDQLARVPIEGASVLAGILDGGAARYLTPPELSDVDASLAVVSGDGAAVAVVPLAAGEEVAGVLVVGQSLGRAFDDEEERSLLESIGAMAGRALARSLRYDAEHAASVAFQRASLPAQLPEVEGVVSAARYRPATSSADVGGDWYDVVSLDDGRVAVVVGDVVGHGVTAAAAMGHLRSAVRVLAGALPEPGDLLPALTAEVASLPDALGATMAYGVVDPVAATFRHVLAGHLPPLIVHLDGGAEVLGTPPWPPLGVAPDGPPVVVTAPLRPGDTVLLYTDGVVERRGESIDVGLERLRAAAANLAGQDPEHLCDALLDAVVPEDHQADDVALVAIRLASARDVVDLTSTDDRGLAATGGDASPAGQDAPTAR